MIEINWKPTRGQLRQFAWTLGAMLVVVGAWLWYRIGIGPATIVWALALAAVAIGLLMPKAMRTIYLGWMGALFPIGWLASNLLLAMVFYLFVTPLGLVLRLFKHDPLNTRIEPGAKTYWQPRSQSTGVRRYFRQF